jgi:hypothetical protein
LALAVTARQARELALALENASEAPHFDRTAFRTPRRIFATLAKDGADVNLMFDHVLQEFYCEQAPDAFAPVPGGWGRMGATRCLLNAVEPETFRGALSAAHARANLPLPGRARRRT